MNEMTPEPQRFPCGECGQMVEPRERHTYEDCQKWRAALAAEKERP